MAEARQGPILGPTTSNTALHRHSPTPSGHPPTRSDTPPTPSGSNTFHTCPICLAFVLPCMQAPTCPSSSSNRRQSLHIALCTCPNILSEEAGPSDGCAMPSWPTPPLHPAPSDVLQRTSDASGTNTFHACPICLVLYAGAYQAQTCSSSTSK